MAAGVLPAERLVGLQGMIEVSARASLVHEGHSLNHEYASVTFAIIPSDEGDESGTEMFDKALATSQSGRENSMRHSVNVFLQHPTRPALEFAVQRFDNTDATRFLWAFIQIAPQQQLAIDLERSTKAG